MIRYELYRIEPQLDRKNVAFCSFNAMLKLQHRGLDCSIYGLIYDGTDTEAADLEQLYRHLYEAPPEDFRAGRMRVSDVVTVTAADKIETGSYFCDTYGFKPVEFQRELTDKE